MVPGTWNGDNLYCPFRINEDVYVIRTFMDEGTKQFYSGVETGFIKHIYLNNKNELYCQVICWGWPGSNLNGKTSLNFKASNVFKTEEEAKARLEALKK